MAQKTLTMTGRRLAAVLLSVFHCIIPTCGAQTCEDIYLVAARGTEEEAIGSLHVVTDNIAGFAPTAHVEPLDPTYTASLEPTYEASVATGHTALISKVYGILEACPDARIALLGYSQV